MVDVNTLAVDTGHHRPLQRVIDDAGDSGTDDAVGEQSGDPRSGNVVHQRNLRSSSLDNTSNGISVAPGGLNNVPETTAQKESWVECTHPLRYNQNEDVAGVSETVEFGEKRVDEVDLDRSVNRVTDRSDGVYFAYESNSYRTTVRTTNLRLKPTIPDLFESCPYLNYGFSLQPRVQFRGNPSEPVSDGNTRRRHR